MGALINFRRGGGQAQKKGPHHEVKSSEKTPKNEKNVAKRPPYEEKVTKRPPNIAKKIFFPRRRTTAYFAPPLRAPMIAIAWLYIIVTISCIKSEY